MNDPTLALDPVTMTSALAQLAREIGGERPWLPLVGEAGKDQQRFLNWYYGNGGEVERISNLKTKASGEAAVLNAFLQENGFAPLFLEIDPGDIGIAAILDLFVESAEATAVEIFRRADAKLYRGFEIPLRGIRLLNVLGYDRPVAKVFTKSGDSVWLAMTNRPADELAMIEQASALLAANFESCKDYASVRIPTVEIDSQAYLRWMLGLSMGNCWITQAFQLLKLRMNEEGTATDFAATRELMLPTHWCSTNRFCSSSPGQASRCRWAWSTPTLTPGRYRKAA